MASSDGANPWCSRAMSNSAVLYFTVREGQTADRLAISLTSIDSGGKAEVISYGCAFIQNSDTDYRMRETTQNAHIVVFIVPLICVV